VLDELEGFDKIARPGGREQSEGEYEDEVVSESRKQE